MWDFVCDGAEAVGEVAVDAAETAVEAANDTVEFFSEHIDDFENMALGAATAIGGGVLIAAGGTLAAGGATACATGILCPAGLPAIAVGGGAITVGGGMFVAGAAMVANGFSGLFDNSGGGGGGGSSGPSRGNEPPFRNHMKDSLPDELAQAERLGVKPMSPADGRFDEMLEGADGQVKWAVLENGQLVVIPKYAGGEEIKHTVLSGGQPVLAAGEANIAGGSGGYYGLEINYNSGHYLPSTESLQTGVDAFARFGITF